MPQIERMASDEAVTDPIRRYSAPAAIQRRIAARSRSDGGGAPAGMRSPTRSSQSATSLQWR